MVTVDFSNLVFLAQFPFEELLTGLIFPVLCLALGWYAIRAVLAVTGTVAWSLSGESGSLLFEGFCSKGVRYRRTIELQKVLAHVALAVRLNLPLAPALDSAAAGESGRVRRMLKGLAKHLTAGAKLSEAFAAVIRNCPRLILIILQRGEHTGHTRDALTDLEQMLADRLIQGPERPRTAVTLALITILFCFTILSGIMYWIIPKFREIFVDYDAQLPAITEWLITVSPLAAQAVPVVLGLLALFAVLSMVGGWGDRHRKPGLIAGAIGMVRWALPVTRFVDYGLGMAAVLRHLALCLKAGLPLDRVGGFTPSLAVTNHLRYRLSTFEHDLTAGMTPHQAAGKARLGMVFVSALKMVERGEDPQTALIHAADYYQSIADRWRKVFDTVIEPAATLVAASIAGFVVVAMFVPLIALINSVMESMV